MNLSKVKVFGVGLSKTGTKSLACALNKFGLEIYHFPTVHQLTDKNGAVDTPVIAFLPQILSLYPDAKLICTVRGLEDWLVSCKNHFLPTKSYYIQMVRRLVYGSDLPTKQDLVSSYHKHQELIKSLNPLIIDCFNEGNNCMEKIGEFLDFPVKNNVYPHIK